MSDIANDMDLIMDSSSDSIGEPQDPDFEDVIQNDPQHITNIVNNRPPISMEPILPGNIVISNDQLVSPATPNIPSPQTVISTGLNTDIRTDAMQEPEQPQVSQVQILPNPQEDEISNDAEHMPSVNHVENKQHDLFEIASAQTRDKTPVTRPISHQAIPSLYLLSSANAVSLAFASSYTQISLFSFESQETTNIQLKPFKTAVMTTDFIIFPTSDGITLYDIKSEESDSQPLMLPPATYLQVDPNDDTRLLHFSSLERKASFIKLPNFDIQNFRDNADAIDISNKYTVTRNGSELSLYLRTDTSRFPQWSLQIPPTSQVWVDNAAVYEYDGVGTLTIFDAVDGGIVNVVTGVKAVYKNQGSVIYKVNDTLHYKDQVFDAPDACAAAFSDNTVYWWKADSAVPNIIRLASEIPQTTISPQLAALCNKLQQSVNEALTTTNASIAERLDVTTEALTAKMSDFDAKITDLNAYVQTVSDSIINFHAKM